MGKEEEYFLVPVTSSAPPNLLDFAPYALKIGFAKGRAKAKG
jgi:hypothetical protein